MKMGFIFIAINVLMYFGINHFFTVEENFWNFGLNLQNAHLGYTFITSAFNHAGLLHLGMNMFFVYQISSAFESVYETKKEQILVYFLSSIPINLLSFSYMYFANIENTMVGYSGVCFALIGALWFAINTKAKKSFAIQILLFHAVVMYLGVPIAWYAHLSGFIVGILISKILKKY